MSDFQTTCDVLMVERNHINQFLRFWNKDFQSISTTIPKHMEHIIEILKGDNFEVILTFETE